MVLVQRVTWSITVAFVMLQLHNHCYKIVHVYKRDVAKCFNYSTNIFFSDIAVLFVGNIRGISIEREELLSVKTLKVLQCSPTLMLFFSIRFYSLPLFFYSCLFFSIAVFNNRCVGIRRRAMYWSGTHTLNNLFSFSTSTPVVQLSFTVNVGQN